MTLPPEWLLSLDVYFLTSSGPLSIGTVSSRVAYWQLPANIACWPAWDSSSGGVAGLAFANRYNFPFGDCTSLTRPSSHRKRACLKSFLGAMAHFCRMRL